MPMHNLVSYAGAEKTRPYYPYMRHAISGWLIKDILDRQEKGFTLREIAEITGTSPEYVHRTVTRWLWKKP